MTTTCLQYVRPASGQTNSEIFGLDVAVTHFLNAYFRYSQQQKFLCRPSDLPSFEHFCSLATAQGHKPEECCIGLDPRTPQHNMAAVDCLFRPDPLIDDLIWQRQQVGGNAYAICGLVHTMSGERIARTVGQLTLAPADAGDALICPSPSIRDAVQKLWQLQSEYLAHRCGTAPKNPIDTPVIPLGITTDVFAARTTPDKRAAQRAALHAPTDEVILLFIGRMSFATKAHPLAMWQAVESVAQKTTTPIRLVMYGYFKPQDMEKHFRNLAADAMHHVRYDFITNDDPRFPDGLWAGADILISLSDNIQESFGLIPVEAMAAGLPALVSDWDGYRGSIRHGEDGFLIPTLTPPIKSGLDIARAYFNEPNYGVALMGAVQSTAVDSEACAAALLLLVDNPALRARFAASGRARARSVFDWRVIIAAYENLWGELAERRRASTHRATLPPHWQAAHPAYPNPFYMFQSFPSAILAPHDHIQVILDKAAIAMLLRHEMNYFIPQLLVPQETMMELIAAIAKAGAPRLGDILAAFPPSTHHQIQRCIGWMIKHGVARRVTAQEKTA